MAMALLLCLLEPMRRLLLLKHVTITIVSMPGKPDIAWRAVLPIIEESFVTIPAALFIARIQDVSVMPT